MKHTCKHCGKAFDARVGRGLCRTCWEDQPTRDKYSPLANTHGQLIAPRDQNVKRPIIDQEFEDLLPRMNPDERSTLEAKLLQEGFRESLIVWKEEGILLDGHNRLEICEKLNLHYYCEEISLPDRAAALQWIIDHQLARRNLTDNQRAYYIGKEYLARKGSHGGPRVGVSPQAGAPNGATSQTERLLSDTSETVAAEHDVSPATVHRAAEFAEAVDAIGQDDPEAKEEILAGESGQSRQEVIEGARRRFCDWCRKSVPVKDCPKCAELNESLPKKKRVRDRSPKPGTEKFDWKGLEAAFGILARAPDDLARAYPKEKGSTEYQGLLRLLKEVGELLFGERRGHEGWKYKILNLKG